MTGRVQGQLARLSDGAQVRWWRHGESNAARSVLLLHGGPGLPDYLEPVAELVADLGPVHRYDQRGTGGSEWQGEHTVERHVEDLAELLDVWGLSRTVLVGHSYGTELACRFVLAHPDRVAGVVLIAGPFVGEWREAYRVTRRSRLPLAQIRRYEELDALASRTEAEEVEFLTLSWCTDHADPDLGWSPAAVAARTRRPVNYAMNSQLSERRRAAPLDARLAELRTRLPARTVILGGTEDPRPAEALRRLAHELDVPLTLLDGAGHEPWLDRPKEFAAAFRPLIEAWS